MNTNEVVYNIIEALEKAQLQNITGIYNISPENPSYPYIKISIANVYSFSTFAENILKIQILCERFSPATEVNFIDELAKIKDVIKDSNLNLKSWNVLYKKFSKITFKQEKIIIHGSVNFEFMLKEKNGA